MLIFLDFDGVTHPRTGSPPFLPTCMEALKQAMGGLDIEIVVTSTWREDINIKELRKLLSPIGKPVIAVTPIIDEPFTHHVRYQEVHRYLRESGLEQEQWCAIDDTRGFYPEHAAVYWTNPMTGFLMKDVSPFQSLLRQVSQGT